MQANVKVGTATARGGGRTQAREPGLGDLLSPAELGAWRGFLRVHAELIQDLDASLRAAHDISLSGYEVLMLLSDAPGGRMRISELSRATILSVSGVSRLVDRLAAAGLVTKEACEDDARGAFAALTASGRGRVRAARASHLAEVRRRFLEHLSDDEMAALASVWERMVPGSAGGGAL